MPDHLAGRVRRQALAAWLKERFQELSQGRTATPVKEWRRLQKEQTRKASNARRRKK